MKIVEINAFADGSTGNIMMQIAKRARQLQQKAITFSTIVFSVKGVPQKQHIPEHHYFSSYIENFIHYSLAQCTDGNGLFSVFATIRLIKQIKKIKPDILQLHNLHEYCISFPLLFRYIRKERINTVWTFHDCWAFTGHCMHFDYAECERWKTGCGKCRQKHINPRCRVERSRYLWQKKKKCFTSADTLTIVTPSEWLAGLVRQSFLQSFPVKVIHNGIDTEVFSPVKSDFREKNRLTDKHIVLGVASDWGVMKGLDVFVKMSCDLKETYKVVLIGVDEALEKQLPANIYCIRRTQDKHELASIYTAADVFANPTREDTFPTVNIEALACGTPVVTYNTGGSPEILDKTCGSVVNKDDYLSFMKEIIRICEEKPYQKDNCIKRAEQFRAENSYNEYISLYERIYGGSL